MQGAGHASALVRPVGGLAAVRTRLAGRTRADERADKTLDAAADSITRVDGRISDTVHMVGEMHETGAAAVEMLDDQGKSLERSLLHARSTRAEADAARGILSSMLGRACCNKTLLLIVIFLLVVANAVVLYFKLTKPH